MDKLACLIVPFLSAAFFAWMLCRAAARGDAMIEDALRRKNDQP